MSKTKKPKKKKTIVDHILTFIILASLSLTTALGLNELDSNRIATQASESITLSSVSAEDIQKNKDADVSFDYSNIQPVTADNIQSVLQGVNVRDLPVIGGIAIPSLKINLPIINGVSDAAMFTGASTLSPTQQMGEGNYPLASHRSLYEGVLFGSLYKAELGEKIYISDLTNVYEYTIIENEVYPPTAMHVLDETETGTITLITCTIDSKERVIIRGEVSSQWTLDEAPQDVLEALSAESQSGYENSIQ